MLAKRGVTDNLLNVSILRVLESSYKIQFI